MTAAAPSLPAGYRLYPRARVGSTNDEAKALALAGGEDGSVVWALEQSAGRGRHGRAWVSPAGNLYMSILTRPERPPGEAAALGFVAGLAVAEALGELAPTLPEPRCKWPNDILVGGRKIAGILLEAEVGVGGRLGFVVVGIGVNLVSAPPAAAFPATSVAGEGAPAPAPAAALAAVVRSFDRWNRLWLAQGFAPVRAAWRERALALGSEIRVRLETATLHGRFADIDQDGALLLDTGGELRRISAGDVFPAR